MQIDLVLYLSICNIKKAIGIPLAGLVISDPYRNTF